MNENKIQLDVVAVTEQAVEAIGSLVTTGERGLNRLNALGETGLSLSVAQAKVNLDLLLVEAKELEAKIEQGGTFRVDGSAALSILNSVNSELRSVGAAVTAVAAESQAALASSGSAIAGVAAQASTEVEAGLAPIVAVGAEVTASIAAVEEELAKLADTGAGLGEVLPAALTPFQVELAEVAAKLDDASTRMERFEVAVENGARGAVRQSAVLLVTIESLREEIAGLATAGADVSVLEARLAELEARLAAGAAAAGKFRAAMKDATDQMRLATINAGEFRGQVGSLQELLELSGLKFVGPLFAIQAGFGLIKSATDSFWNVAGPIFTKFEENLYLSKDRLVNFITEYNNLANVLEHEGVEAGGRQLKELRDIQQQIIEQSQELEGAIRGQAAAEEVRDAALLKAGNDLLNSSSLTYAATVNYVALLDKQIETEKNAGANTRLLETERLAFINQGTEALLRQGIRLRENEALGEEGTSKFLALLNQQINVLDNLAVKTRDTERERQALVQESIAVLERRQSVILQDGLSTTAQANQFLETVRKQIAALQALGENTTALESLARSFERLARAAQLDNLSEGLRKLRQFSDEAINGGRISTQQADIIVDSYNKIVKEIAALPESERQMYTARLKQVQIFYTQFFKFSTAYIDEVKKEAQTIEAAVVAEKKAYEDRLKAYQKFVADLNAAARDLPGSQKETPPASADDLNRQIQAKRDELRGLESKTFQGPDDLNQIETLRNEIQGLTKDLVALGGGAQGAGGDFADLGTAGQAATGKIEAALTDLIQNNEAFRKSFQRLPAETKAAIEQLVTGFVSDLHSGVVTSEADVQHFEDQFLGLLKSGGAVSAGLLDRLNEIGGGAGRTGDQLGHMFDGIRETEPEVTRQIQDVVNQVLHLLGVSQEFKVVLDAQGQAHVLVAQKAQAQATAETAVGTAASGASAGYVKMGDTVIRLAGANKQADSSAKGLFADTVSGAVSATAEVKKLADEADRLTGAGGRALSPQETQEAKGQRAKIDAARKADSGAASADNYGVPRADDADLLPTNVKAPGGGGAGDASAIAAEGRAAAQTSAALQQLATAEQGQNQIAEKGAQVNTAAGSATASAGTQAAGASQGYIRLTEATQEQKDAQAAGIAVIRQGEEANRDGAAAATEAGQADAAATVEIRTRTDATAAATQGEKDAVAGQVESQKQLAAGLDAWHKTDEAQQQAADSAGSAASATTDVGTAAASTSSALVDAAGHGGELVSSFVEIKKGATEADEGVTKADGTVIKFSTSLDTAAGKAKEVADGTEHAATAVEAVATKTEAATTALAGFGDGVSGVADKATLLDQACQPLVATVGQLPAPLKAVAEHLKGIADSGAADAVNGIAQGLTDLVPLADEAGTKAKALETDLGEITKKLKEMLDGIKEVRPELQGLVTDLGAVTKAANAATTACQALAKCQSGSAS